MKHKALADCCTGLGLDVRHIGYAGAVTAWEAIKPGVRVFWTRSVGGKTVVGRPLVTVPGGRSAHAKNLKEVQYLVKG